MKSLSTIVLLSIATFLVNALNAQIQVNLPAGKDNTLYESITNTALSNGLGAYLFVAQTNHGEARRTLVAFDIAGNIPANAVIESATLTLNMSKTFVAAAQTVTLHRVFADWGEGTSNAGGEEGGGIAATTGDATWFHTFFNTQFWTTPGGDFSPTASATQSVAGLNFYTWGSTSEIVADVQAWLNAPASNFGWLLLSNESTNGSSKRFDSRQNPVAGNRPVLTVTYTTSTEVRNEVEATPAKFELAQNYPNPFNPNTVIGFDLPAASEVTLGVYNLNGLLIKQLTSGRYESGKHEVVWNGKNEAGERVASGIYVYKLTASSFMAQKKLLLMK